MKDDFESKIGKKILLRQRDAAAHLIVSESWLERERWKKTGPKYIRIGRAIRYSLEDINEYIQSRTIKTRDF